MAFSLPNPTTPTNGQLGDATPILANELAIAQAIAAFDGSQINAKSVVEGALADAINSRLRGSETLSNFVYSGCIRSSVSGLNGTMTGGITYINGYRNVVTGVGSNTFAASSDTYVYVDYLGNITYQAVSNNAASPSATANAILVAIVTTNNASIIFINQGQTDTTLASFSPVISSNNITVSDSLGNLIYPTDPSSKILAFRQITSNFATAAGSFTDIIGLNLTAICPLNRKIKLMISIPQMFSAGATIVSFQIVDVTNSNTVVFSPTVNPGNTMAQSFTPSKILIPPASGVRNYKLQVQTGGGGPTFNTSSTTAATAATFAVELD